MNLHDIATRVAARHLLAQEGAQVVPKKYLQALLGAIGPEHDDEWGSYRQAQAPLERWLRLITKGDDLYGVPPNREALLENLENRGVPSWEMDALKAVPESKVRPKAPAKVDEKAWVLLDEVAGNPLVLSGDLRHPEYNEHVRALVKALHTLKSKFPFAWSVYNHKVKQLYLTTRGSGTEDASWQDWVGGGRLAVVFKPTSFISISLLLHEIGHVYEGNFDILGLMDIYGMGHEPFVSSYAKKNTSEDFAETFMYYWLNRNHLKKSAPAKYADMHHRITMGR